MCEGVRVCEGVCEGVCVWLGGFTCATEIIVLSLSKNLLK